MSSPEQTPTLLGTLLNLNRAVKEDPSNIESLQELFPIYPVVPTKTAQLAIECARGCFRFSKVLNSTVHNFFNHPFGETASRKDSSLYLAITYIVIFQFRKIGLEQFTEIVGLQSTRNLYFFLSYLLDTDNIQTWLFQEWCKSYDTEFVINNIQDPLLSISELMQDYLQELNDKIDSRKTPKLPNKPKIPSTQVAPFNLSEPKPKPKPELEEIILKQHYKPVDPKLYQQPEELAQIERAKEANKKCADQKLNDAQKSKPRCATGEKSDKTKARIQEIADERDGAFKESRTRKAKPFVASKLDDNLVVKKNAASILREGLLFQKEEQKKIQELLDLEAGGKDASEYFRWQENVLQEQLEAEQFEVEKKHLMGRLTYEEAIIAKQKLSEDNKVLVEQLKEERQALLDEYFREREEEKRHMQRLVEEIAAGKENAKLAQEKLKEMKKKIVEEMSRENRALMQAAIEMAQAEMEKKMEMIQQIRAMERVPIIRVKFVDMTETGGHGLLSEMSIAELNERVNLMKTAVQEEEEQRRVEIIQGKKERHELLESTMEFIKEARSNQTREKSRTIPSTKQASKKAKESLEVLALREKLLARQNLRKEKTKERILSPKQSSNKKANVNHSNAKLTLNSSVLASL